MRDEYDFSKAEREYFSDSQSVNDALRSLIELMEKVPAKKYGARQSGSHQIAEEGE